MISAVNSHTNATRIGWYLWEIDLRFASGLSAGWDLVVEEVELHQVLQLTSVT